MIRKITANFTWIEEQIFASLGFLAAIFYFAYRLILPVKPGSHPISKLLRPVFEHQKASTYWSLALLLIILLLNFLHIPANNRFNKQANFILAASEEVIITQSGYQQPVAGKISQGFHWYHQALDLEAPLGTKIYPVAEGIVQEAKYTSIGYGHFIIIQHDLNHQSLYAHLGLIEVESGQKVDKNTILGYVGLTGWTTGPHLHLEVLEEGKNLDPQEVLPEFTP